MCRRQQMDRVENQRGAWATEMRTVQLIILHLIKNDAVLVLVEDPQQNEGEADEVYRARRLRDRVLAISPNYAEA